MYVNVCGASRNNRNSACSSETMHAPQLSIPIMTIDRYRFQKTVEIKFLNLRRSLILILGNARQQSTKESTLIKYIPSLEPPSTNPDSIAPITYCVSQAILRYSDAMKNSWECKILYDSVRPFCKLEARWMAKMNRLGRLKD